MAEILYNEEKHEYTLNGEIVPSVTELARKFTGYDTAWLEKHPEFAEVGTEIDPRFQTEVLVYNEKQKYAGTADVVVIEGKRCLTIIDWKTGAHINKLYCRCQLSLYYLAIKEMGIDVSTTKLCVVTPQEMFAFEPFTWAEMQNLLADFAPTDESAKQIAELEDIMDKLTPYVEQYDDCKERLKKLLSEGFEDTNTRRYNGEHFSFTYVPATTRKSFDSCMARQIINDDEAYEACFKQSPVSASVRIKEI